MKILLIIDHFGSGGAQRQIILLAKALLQKGYEIEFATYYNNYHFKGYLHPTVIKIHKLNKRFRLDFLIIFKLRKIIKLNNYDVTISFLNTPNFYNEIASLFLSNKVIVSERSSQIKSSKKDYVKHLILRFFHILSDVVVTNCVYNSYPLKKYSFLKNKIITIYNAVDDSIFTFQNINHLSKTHTNRSFLVVSRLSKEKNPINLIKAIGMLPQCTQDNISISWVGKIQDKTLYYNCVNLLQSINYNKWNWLGEIQNIQTLYHQYNALIHPSFREGFPNVIAEAMYSGLFVIASNICDHPLIIKEGINGYLFSPDNPREIADKIDKYLKLESDHILGICENAYKTAKNKFNLQRLLREYEKLF